MLKKMKKRYFIIGWIALEIACIPAAAQIVDKIVFTAPERVIAVKVDTIPGRTRFLVASNSGFSISSEDAIGPLDITVIQSGRIGNKTFGANAQLPGPASACAAPVSALSSVVYKADRKTAAISGEIESHAVIVEMHYDKSAEPDFTFLTAKKAEGLPMAPACDSFSRVG